MLVVLRISRSVGLRSECTVGLICGKSGDVWWFFCCTDLKNYSDKNNTRIK